MLTESLELLKDHTGAQYTLIVNRKIFYTTVGNADHLLHLNKQVRKQPRAGLMDYMQFTPFAKQYRLCYGNEFGVLLVEHEHNFSLDKDILGTLAVICRIATYRKELHASYLTDKYTGLPNRDAVFEVLEKQKYSTLAYIKVCNRRELVRQTGVEYYDKMITIASEVLLRNQSQVFRTSVESFTYLLSSDISGTFIFMQDILGQIENETELVVSAYITPIGEDVRFALYLCENHPFAEPWDIYILRDIKE